MPRLQSLRRSPPSQYSINRILHLIACVPPIVISGEKRVVLRFRVTYMGNNRKSHCVLIKRLSRVLREVKGNKYRAAKKLGITRSTLYGKLRKHGIMAPDKIDINV